MWKPWFTAWSFRSATYPATSITAKSSPHQDNRSAPSCQSRHYGTAERRTRARQQRGWRVAVGEGEVRGVALQGEPERHGGGLTFLDGELSEVSLDDDEAT